MRKEGQGRGFPLALLIILLISLISLQGVLGYWSQWRGDPLHKGIEDGMPTGMGELIWKYPTNGQVYSSPVFFEGGMLIGSDDWNLYCLDPDTGDLNWKFKTGGEVQSTPYISDGKAYFGSLDRFFYCLNLPEDRNGRPGLEWRLELEGDVISSCHPYRESLLVADSGGFVHRISLDGESIWKERLSNDDYWASPIIDADNGRGIIGNITDSIQIFSLEDGTLLSEIDYGAGSEIYSSSLLVDDILYITDGEGRRLIAEDLSGEKRGWTFDIGFPSYSTPVIDGNRLYFGSFEYAWCLPVTDPDSSGIIEEDEVIWSTPTHDFQGGSSPLVAGDMVFIGSDDYNLYCMDKMTGEVRWTYRTNGYIYSSPSLYNGSVYFGSNDRFVYCVGERPPGIVLEVSLDPLEITSNETAMLWINVTDGEGNLVNDARVSVVTSAGTVSLGPDEIVNTPVITGSGWIHLRVNPIEVSSRSTIDISVSASMEGLTPGTASLQLVVEPGDAEESSGPDVIDRQKERVPYIIGLIIIIVINISLLMVIVLFRIRDMNTEREEFG
jgi:outer membrane protein assembly factor BamB